MNREGLALVASSVGVAGGLAVAGSVSQTAGGVIVVLAWVAFVFSLHRYGRLGA